MVENDIYLNGLFSSLADPTRRDILHRLILAQHTIGELARNYDMSFAAVAKHLTVLEKAKLVIKKRKGNEQIVSIAPAAVRDASHYLQQYEVLWTDRFDGIDTLLKGEK